MFDRGFTRPDLCSIRAVIGQAEFAAVRGLLSADGYPPTDDDQLAPLAQDVARTLIEAGFTLHHRDRHELLWRLIGVSLMPIPAKSGTGRSTIAVSRTTHDLMFDWDWRATCSHACQLVNAAPGSVLHAFGYLDRQRGTGGASLATGHRGQRTEAGR